MLVVLISPTSEINQNTSVDSDTTVTKVHVNHCIVETATSYVAGIDGDDSQICDNLTTLRLDKSDISVSPYKCLSDSGSEFPVAKQSVTDNI